MVNRNNENWLKGLKEGNKPAESGSHILGYSLAVKKSVLTQCCNNCLTLTNLLPYGLNALSPCKRFAFAFTMAEILISLTIIGIIAAITLPSLVGNIKEKAWATQRKALYSRMSQAISMMPSLNGYGTYAGSWSADSVTVTNDTAAQAFVTDGLSKVLNINNICTIAANTNSNAARSELKKCGIPDKLTNMANSKIDFPTRLSELNPYFVQTFSNQYYTLSNPQHNTDTVAAAFETKNGESVAVFYNPFCMDSSLPEKSTIGSTVSTFFPQRWMCANFIYDLNGKKGPNKAGKDIGAIVALYPTDSEVVAPMPLTSYAKSPTNSASYVMHATKAAAACRKHDKESRVPNVEEAAAIMLNSNLFALDHAFWTTKFYDDNLKAVWASDAFLRIELVAQSCRARCIKR